MCICAGGCEAFIFISFGEMGVEIIALHISGKYSAIEVLPYPFKIYFYSLRKGL